MLTTNWVLPNPTNSSNIGKATTGKSGIEGGVQLFLYNNFFIGGFLGVSGLDVSQPEYTGNYSRSSVTFGYFQVGYEFPIQEKLRLGLSFVPFGESRYKNILSNSSNVYQVDNARFVMLGTHLSYKVSGPFYIFAGYAFRSDKTEIKTAPEFQDQFKSIQYHSVSFGVKFYIGNKSFF
ncbi:hypothetical protein [Neotamlana nanhaiensis]|uniref:hypothetical protein n=1 Tax=Neotamlana nanhaiensis TaxID=1382798 RepID=UPI00103F86EF|nr:hypothetical protein [Tamlana nanhaiensis]